MGAVRPDRQVAAIGRRGCGRVEHDTLGAGGGAARAGHVDEAGLARTEGTAGEASVVDTRGLIERAIGGREADPGLVDYLSLLLARFVHIDALHRLHAGSGKTLEEVADMLMEAEAMPPGRTSREVHRHIGDYTLFWTGVYPEALRRLRSVLRKDHFVDYCNQGKRSYFIASTFADAPYREEAPVLRRLSEEFELCAYGLNQVRREWERKRRQGLS